MKNLPTLIKTEQQYQQYCRGLEALLTEAPVPAAQDEIDLLTLFIETWDAVHVSLPAAAPVELRASLMAWYPVADLHTPRARLTQRYRGSGRGPRRPV